MVNSMINPRALLKVSGIFDEKSLNLFQGLGVFNFGFDLRPKSFNFIQEHVLTSLLNKLQIGSVTLSFENEKDFVIQRILEQCQKVFSGSINLEFFGNENFEMFDSFELPYFFCNKNSVDVIKGRNQVGYMLFQELLVEFQEQGKAFPLYQSPGEKTYLKFSRSLELPESITDFISWDMLDLEITLDICQSYRSIDENQAKILISQMISFVKNKDK